MGKKKLWPVAAALVGVGAFLFIRSKQKEPKVVEWTSADMPNLRGKVVIVTGANSGIGFTAAKAFIRKGAQTILACRNMEKAEAALAEIKAAKPNAPAEIMQLDLASLESVRSFAAAFKEKYDRLDLLINNAGIMMVPYGLTDDGYEKQFGTNHLGHFALTGLLIDRIKATPGARVVNVSSNGHKMGEMDFDNMMFDGGEGYSGMAAYGRSKLANLLFTLELQRRFTRQGIDALATAAHPGGTDTNLGAHMADSGFGKIVFPIFMRFAQSATMGALPTIRAAVDPDAEGGDYFGPDGFAEQAGFPIRVKMSAAAQDIDDAEKLWEVSQRLTGVEFL